jgi:hypothetical protein
MDTKSSGLFGKTEEQKISVPEQKPAPTPSKEAGGDTYTELGAYIRAIQLIAYDNYLTGQILTIVDASVPEGEQKKAMKSLIKQAVWKSYDAVWEWMNKIRGNEVVPFPFDSVNSIE